MEKLSVEKIDENIVKGFEKINTTLGEINSKADAISSGIQGSLEPNSPKPVNKGQYVLVKEGEYVNIKNKEGETIKITEEDLKSNIVYVIYDGEYFVINKIPINIGRGEKNGVAPLDENRKIPNENLTFGEVKEGDNNVVSGDKVALEINQFLVNSRNLFEGNFQRGYYAEAGNYNTSINWICTPRFIVEDFLKGKEVTLSGFGYAGVISSRFVIRNSSNKIVLQELGKGNDLSKVTFTMPLDAHFMEITIANDGSNGGIGSRPNYNDFVNTFMFNEGAEPLPYENDKLINSEKLDYKVKEIDAELNNKIKSVTYISPNLFDTKTEVQRGYYAEAGNYNTSINWISTIDKKVPQEVKGKKVTISGFGYCSTIGSRVLIKSDTGSVLVNELGKGSDISDVVIDVPLVCDTWSFTIANDSSNGGIGSRPTNNIFTNTFQVEIGDKATIPLPYGELFLNADKLVLPKTYNTNEVVVLKNSNTSIDIITHNGGANDKWFRTTFYRQVNVEKFIDTWRLNEGYICKRTSENTFVNTKQVILKGVWENAMYTSDAGYTDAMGSSHGWEELESFTFFLDGKILDISKIDSYIIGTHFQAFQNSYFKNSNGVGNIGNSLKQWDIKQGVIIVKNSINWLGQLNILVNSYLSMLSVIRKSANGEQITHTALSNTEMIPYDVSEEGFTTPIYTDQTNPLRNKLVIWGDDFKIQMSVPVRKVYKADGSVLNNGLKDAGMNVQNTDLYNKLYGRFGKMLVNNGDRFEVETIYEITL